MGHRAKDEAMNAWPADRVERMPVAALIPYARNARTHSDAQVDQLVASMREWGFTVPVLIDDQNEIIAGHGRVLAAERLGLDAVPVMVARGWTPRQIKAYRLADNQLALNAAWDVKLLAAELGELPGLEALIGFGEGQLEAALRGDVADDGRPPPTPEEARQTLAERFGLPPFSVLNAREGWWQDRKRAWIALGIQSELGRGDTGVNAPHEGSGMSAGLVEIRANQKKARGYARTFGQDLMRGEHVVGQSEPQ
jgi:ParB-like chromosome segregation protein Spo0J